MTLGYVPDLMDRSRLGSCGVRFVASPAALVEAVEAGEGGAGGTVVVDLQRPGVLDAVPAMVAAGARVVGFAAHVDTTTLEAAAAAGCALALPRSRFFARLPEVLA